MCLCLSFTFSFLYFLSTSTKQFSLKCQFYCVIHMHKAFLYLSVTLGKIQPPELVLRLLFSVAAPNLQPHLALLLREPVGKASGSLNNLVLVCLCARVHTIFST